MISEQNLINLGFTKMFGEGDWYFYILDVGGVSLTSTESDVVKDGNWTVFVDEYPLLVINNMSNLNGLINILNRILRDETTD